jgi:hypothetical protein
MLSLIAEQLLVGIGGLMIGFSSGTIFGWILRGYTKRGTPPGVNGRKVAVAFVNAIIVILWTVSVANTIFQFNDASTPLFLHACMGAVIGYLNESFGGWLLQMLGRTRNNVTGVLDAKKEPDA